MQPMPPPIPTAQVTEGNVRVHLGNAFYRPHSQRSRDLGVLAAAVYRQQTGRLRVLDAMTGSGIRVLRYGVEAQADELWANDGNPDVAEVLRQNLANFSHCKAIAECRITHESVPQIFWQCAIEQDYYDLIDIDSFGNPAAWVAACLLAVRSGGLIYLTSTDGRAISGHFPQDSLRLYGAYTRSTPSVQEHALRLMMGSLAQQGAMQGFTIEPVFSLYSGQIYRVMVRVQHRVPQFEKHHGFVAYCPSCGAYQLPTWRHLTRASCPDHDRPLPMALVGPLWTGPLHDPNFLQDMIAIAPRFKTLSGVQRFLELLRDEAMLPPFHYPCGEIGRRGKLDIPKRDRLLEELQAQQHLAVRTHFSDNAIKTTASIAEVIRAARAILL